LIELFSKPLCDHLTKSNLKYRPFSLKLKVLGESEELSNPWIVVQCDKAVSKNVRKFFNQQVVRMEYRPRDPDSSFPSFDIYARSEDCATPLPALCGLRIRVGGGDESRFATIGGLIKVSMPGGRPMLYGMTAGHVVPELQYEMLDGQEISCGGGSDNGDEEDFELDLSSGLATPTSGKPEDKNCSKQPLIPWLKIGHIAMASHNSLEDGQTLIGRLSKFRTGLSFRIFVKSQIQTINSRIFGN
jgi:hypothetical protein